MKQVDYLVIGGGLAGLTVAKLATERGLSVQVVDRGGPTSSSRVAAGIIHPITGRRLNKSWKFDTLWDAATRYYRSVERESSQNFFHERPMLRVLRDADQQALWKSRRDRPELVQICREATPEELPAELRAEWGALTVERAAQLDVAHYLRALESILSIERESFRNEELVTGPESFEWRAYRATKLVFCQGHETSTQPLFAATQIRPAGGEILRLSLSSYRDSRILNRGKWLLQDADGSVRAGSTYEWHQLDAGTTREGREEILSGVREMLPGLSIEVLDHFSGIRPMANQGRPVVGTHPKDARLGFLNGLGAKGALLAPYFAAQLLDHMESGAPLDPEVDLHVILARN